jgi:hypothetical protein
MKEIHAGICGAHIESRPLLGKVFKQCFYWPKASTDAAVLVQKCENCQKYARDQKQPSSLTQLIQPSWPLQRWGLYLLGPLLLAQGNLRYVVVAVQYFSKWIKAKPLVMITLAMVQKFFWQNIVCRFDVPKAITVDNGTQFDDETFKTFCDQIGTKIHFVSIRHPEYNGLVERANNFIVIGIIKSIFNLPKGKWPDELVKVVWNHNAVVSRSTRFTLFKLLFGDEAITPKEARSGSIRTLASAEDDDACKIAKYTIEGVRLQAIDRINKYQAKTVKWRERKSKVKEYQARTFGASKSSQPRHSGEITTQVGRSLLDSVFVKTRIIQLKDMDGNDVLRSWNADELRQYYV